MLASLIAAAAIAAPAMPQDQSRMRFLRVEVHKRSDLVALGLSKKLPTSKVESGWPLAVSYQSLSRGLYDAKAADLGMMSLAQIGAFNQAALFQDGGKEQVMLGGNGAQTAVEFEAISEGQEAVRLICRVHRTAKVNDREVTLHRYEVADLVPFGHYMIIQEIADGDTVTYFARPMPFR